MYRAMERSVVIFLILFSVGCGAPETRYLTCIPRPPAVEAASYDLHDPFPDESAGPNTYTRPRAFMEPRSDTRKALDQRRLKATYGFPTSKYTTWGQPVPASVAQPVPASMAQYPTQPIWRTAPQFGQPITW